MKELKNLTVEELKEVAERKIAKVVYIADRCNLRKANGSLSYYINLNEGFREYFLENVQDEFFNSIREENIKKEQKKLENKLEEDLEIFDTEEEQEELREDFEVECEEIRENMYEKCNNEMFEELDREQLIQYINTLEDYSYKLVCDMRDYRSEIKELKF
ncbi:MAG: hypothetical protein E7D50_00880 [Finegoldia magna]|nr:hypothetical protein [Finegoldia magna]